MPEVLSPQTSVAVTPESIYYYLDGTQLWGVTADETNERQEQEIHHLIGWGPKADFGDYLGATGQLTVELRDKQLSGGPSARAQRVWLGSLKARAEALVLETPFGDVYNAVVGDISFSRLAGVGEGRDFGSATIPYTQVIEP